MTFLDGIHYGCALRAKPGELSALAMLRDDVAEKVLPRLIIAPEKERNSLQLNLLTDVGQLNLLPGLKSSWPYRPAIIDVTHVLDQFGRNELAKWLAPALMEAGKAGSSILPCVRAKDLTDDLITGFQVAVHNGLGYFALSVDMMEATDEVIICELVSKLKQYDLDTTKCVILADFIADFGDAETAAPVLEHAFKTLSRSAQWLKIILQSSAYPEKNPASENSVVLVPRGETFAFKLAVAQLRESSHPTLFGDFGADSSKVSFGPSKGRCYPHLRYALNDSWMVVRGSNSGRFNDQMKKVAQQIVDHDGFSGAGFSEADARIQNIADGVMTAGTASDWRAINMCRHITTIINRLGDDLGFDVKLRAVEANPVQMGLSLSNAP